MNKLRLLLIVAALIFSWTVSAITVEDFGKEVGDSYHDRFFPTYAISPNGELIATGSLHSPFSIFRRDPTTSNYERIDYGAQSYAVKLAFSHNPNDLKLAILSSKDHSVKIYNISPQEQPVLKLVCTVALEGPGLGKHISDISFTPPII